MMKDELRHYQRRGAKWGEMHGPPYPLRGDDLREAKSDYRKNRKGPTTGGLMNSLARYAYEAHAESSKKLAEEMRKKGQNHKSCKFDNLANKNKQAVEYYEKKKKGTTEYYEKKINGTKEYYEKKKKAEADYLTKNKNGVGIDKMQEKYDTQMNKALDKLNKKLEKESTKISDKINKSSSKADEFEKKSIKYMDPVYKSVYDELMKNNAAANAKLSSIPSTQSSMSSIDKWLLSKKPKYLSDNKRDDVKRRTQNILRSQKGRKVKDIWSYAYK